MARHRRMLAPISSIKHYVNVETDLIAIGSARTVVLVNAVPITRINASDVVEGSVIKAVYVEMWIKSNATSGNTAKFQLAIEKVVAGATSLTFAQMNNLMAYENKKNVFYVSQGALGDDTTQSVPIHRAWMLIPKGKQRFGAGDSLVVTVTATAGSITNCGLSTYKEYN